MPRRPRSLNETFFRSLAVLVGDMRGLRTSREKDESFNTGVFIQVSSLTNMSPYDLILSVVDRFPVSLPCGAVLTLPSGQSP